MNGLGVIEGSGAKRTIAPVSPGSWTGWRTEKVERIAIAARN